MAWEAPLIPPEPHAVREVAAGPAGPVRIDVQAVRGLQLVVSGPQIPRVAVEWPESDLGRQLREKAEVKAAARGKPPPSYMSQRQFKARMRRADLFERHQGVTLTVAGTLADLRPGDANFKRAGYDVRALVNGREYLLSQVRPRQARVLRDGRMVAGLRRDSSYRQGPRYSDDAAWAEDVDLLDVAMTHALASAYCVGARGAVVNTLIVLGLGIISVLTPS